ncbi:hypothetical protein SPHINGO8AM_30293 [Sphingomonas sp. 8AM]|nr:hypothetical protein SPHINGO8AM_30293 [Sphingomonas sp. 8AM]
MLFQYLPETTYREIADFIYSAQQAGLKLTGRFDPPICGTRER